MRQRLNDNPIVVYAYRVRIPGKKSFVQLPGFIKDEARACMDYWNDLVQLSIADTEAYQLC